MTNIVLPPYYTFSDPFITVAVIAWLMLLGERASEESDPMFTATTISIVVVIVVVAATVVVIVLVLFVRRRRQRLMKKTAKFIFVKLIMM